MALQCCSPSDVGYARGARAPCRHPGGLVGAAHGTRPSALKPFTWIQALVLHRRAFLNALQHFSAQISIARHAQPQPAHKQLWFADQSSIQHKPGLSEHVRGVMQPMSEHFKTVLRALGAVPQAGSARSNSLVQHKGGRSSAAAARAHGRNICGNFSHGPTKLRSTHD